MLITTAHSFSVKLLIVTHGLRSQNSLNISAVRECSLPLVKECGLDRPELRMRHWRPHGRPDGSGVERAPAEMDGCFVTSISARRAG